MRECNILIQKRVEESASDARKGTQSTESRRLNDAKERKGPSQRILGEAKQNGDSQYDVETVENRAVRVKARVWVSCIGLLPENVGRPVLPNNLCFDTGHLLGKECAAQ